MRPFRILPFLVLLAACGDSAEWHTLSRIQLTRDDTTRSVDHTLLDYPQFAHLGRGFTGPQGPGVWSLGPASTLDLWVPGDSLRVRIV